MKLQITALVVAMLTSMSSDANWYVDGVSCLKGRNDGTGKAEFVSVHGTTLEKYAVLQSTDGNLPKRVQDSGDFSASYGTLTKINPRSVWTGLFDWTPIYDGMNLENGVLRPTNQDMMQSRTEIRFKPFTDVAYGPDYASVSIYAKKPSDTNWTLQMAFPDCWVAVYH